MKSPDGLGDFIEQARQLKQFKTLSFELISLNN
jgi:hypothetical protein